MCMCWIIFDQFQVGSSIGQNENARVLFCHLFPFALYEDKWTEMDPNPAPLWIRKEACSICLLTGTDMTWVNFGPLMCHICWSWLAINKDHAWQGLEHSYQWFQILPNHEKWIWGPWLFLHSHDNMAMKNALVWNIQKFTLVWKLKKGYFN